MVVQIANRRCAVYNEAIGTYGAWDASKCTTTLSEQEATICECGTFGTFALIAELEEQPYVKDEYEWLTIVKYMGFVVSIILLLIFVLAIALSR